MWRRIGQKGKPITPVCAMCFLLFQTLFTLSQSEKTDRGAERHAIATEQKTQFQVIGTVVYPSGAAIAGATVRVRRANGTVQRTTRTNAFGAFSISELSEGRYRGEISNAGFETKEISISLGPTQTQDPLSITLTVGLVNTAISVQGREDDLIGIADSGTQGTVGAKQLQDRPILRSGETLETIPGRSV
jgi:hypothetical protein